MLWSEGKEGTLMAAVKKPKVVVIGAGSLFFGRQALFAMVDSPVLREGTLAYVDTDEETLQRMMKLGEMVVERSGAPLTLEGSTDRKDVLPGADFVVLSFAHRGAYYRGVDCRVSLEYGVRMCSGDTIGPGGIFRAMRSLPEALKIAEDVKKLCPDAWVINYVNPTAVNGLGLARHGGVKTFALCDGLHMPHVKRNYMVGCRVVKSKEEITPEMEERFDLRIGGVNHFTWLLSATFDGRDVTDGFRETLKERAAHEEDSGGSKERFNASYSLELWDIFGLCPTCIAHTKEYVPYWQGKSVAPDRLPPLAIFDAEARMKKHEAMKVEVEEYITGKKPLDEFFSTMSHDHATDIIAAMWSGKGIFYVNTFNRGAIGNLPDDSFLEVLCEVNMDGIKPLETGDFPLGLRSLQMQVIDTHELTVEAIVNFDRDLLKRAMLTDPIVNSIADAEKIMENLFREEKDVLPREWFE